MKKFQLIALAVSALALASSCSEDEPVRVRESVNSAITFRSGLSSRATETTNANLESMYVTAFLNDGKTYFENAEYDRNAENEFVSPQQYTWLADKDTIDFFAYSPSQDNLGADITTGTDNLTLENFTVADQIADQVDFITARASGSKAQNLKTGVELTFDHRLAQIQVNAKSENPTYNYKVSGVRIGRPEYVGTYDFAANKWTLDDWHDTFVLTSSCDPVELTATGQSIMGPSGNAMLIPQTLTPWDPVGDPDNVAREAYISVLVQISRKSDGTVVYPYPSDPIDENGHYITSPSQTKRQYAWASIPLSGTWEQGKKYIYTLDFTDGAGNVDPDDPTPGEPVLGAIKFTVNVNPWTDADIPTPMTPTIK